MNNEEQTIGFARLREKDLASGMNLYTMNYSWDYEERFGCHGNELYDSKVSLLYYQLEKKKILTL